MPASSRWRIISAAGRDAPSPGPEIALGDIVRDNPDLGGDGTPLGFLLNTYRVVGALDPCTSYYVAGWVARRAGPKIVVTVLVNGARRSAKLRRGSRVPTSSP